MSFKTLRIDRTASVLTVTLDRPETHNALDEVMLSELCELFTKLPARSDVRGVILAGNGDKAFAAGTDIKRVAEMSVDDALAFSRLGQQVTELMEAAPVPVIACVHGEAIGAGCELPLAADFIYATEDATFGLPEAHLGLIPAFGGCVRLLRRIGPGRAKEMLYTGSSIRAHEATRLGLVNAVFADRRAMVAAAIAQVNVVATRSPIAVTAMKELVRSLDGKSGAAQLALENSAFGRVFASDDRREGVAAFLAKRDPAYIP